ncbi:glycosidase [Dyadobacter jejuensis]|uniref:Glycosidase n=1 Tax=Dyadobacter jejuensis TaxID=1082580 RepID=A0A316AP73_9BACT|nr:alpha-amylase family protein [Dyadobacter jejuensis]PWJ59278.1 glycosidase [Dyadobacter jejuensis]
MTLRNKDKFIIYQIFTRIFSNQNTTNQYSGDLAVNGSGKFNDINHAALKSLQKFGITHVWYTGVIAHASLTDYSAHGLPADHPLIVKGKAGSPYAIRDYYDVDPDLAENIENRMQEFEDLVERTHQQNLQVIIDFVPNHVARSYRSTARPKGVKDFGENDDVTQGFHPQNNFYYIPNKEFIVPEGPEPLVEVQHPYHEVPAKATGNDVFSAQPSAYDWYETVKLNYGVDYLNHRSTHFDPIPSTWHKMYEILAYWTSKGVDGFRCDMAEMVPVEFWGWVIPQIKELNPNILFIAEIYNPSLYHQYIAQGHFDYLYDKVGLYNTLRPLMEGRGDANDLTRIWQQESGDISEHMLRFLENHDEQRIASEFFAGDPWIAVPAITLSATMHTGPFMLYAGQELGVNPQIAEGFQGHDGRSTIFDYWGIPEMQEWINGGQFNLRKMKKGTKELRAFYAELNQLITSQEAIHSGAFYDLQYVNINGQSRNYDGSRLYSFLRHTDHQKLLLIFNFDRQQTFQTSVKIPYHAWHEVMGLDQPEHYTLQPIFRNEGKSERIEATGIIEEGIDLKLQPLQVCIFMIERKKQ